MENNKSKETERCWNLELEERTVPLNENLKLEKKRTHKEELPFNRNINLFFFIFVMLAISFRSSVLLAFFLPPVVI